MAFDTTSMRASWGSIAALAAALFSVGTTHAQDHLLITEVVVTPNPSTFIEIMNPTDVTVSLADYYLSDTGFYALLPGRFGAGPPPGGLGDFDFIARFPSGSSISAGEVQTIAFDGAGFLTAFLSAADYELWGTDPTTPDMLEPYPDAIGVTAGLTDAGESAVLFRWNGMTDLVRDIDMLNIGTPSGANDIADKTGLMVDGPDPGVIQSTYAPDAHTMPLQASDPAAGESTKRIALEAGFEERCGGSNGVQEQDETSEDILVTWDTVFTKPSPGVIDLLDVLALDMTWSNLAGGLYCDMANWTADPGFPDGGPPTRLATFGGASTYTVQVEDDPVCAAVNILQADVTFAPTGGPFALTLDSTTDPSLVVPSIGTTGRLTITGNGTIDAQAVEIGTMGLGFLTLEAASQVIAEQVTVGAYPFYGGTLTLGPSATITSTTAISVDTASEIYGSGTVDADLLVLGTTAPGTMSDPTGGLDVSGTYDQLGSLEIELGGDTNGLYDHVDVGGVATLGGALHVDLIDAFVPVSGTFTLIDAADVSGRFNVAELPDIGGGMFLEFTFASPFAGPGGMSVSPAPLPAATSFEPPSIITVIGEPTDFVIVDLDGVLGPDIAMTIPDMTLPQFGDGSVLVLYNDGTGGFSLTPFAGGGGSQEFLVGEYPSAIATGLLDDNDSYDLAVTNRDDGTVSLLFNNGDGTFPDPPDEFTLQTEHPIDIAAGNFNGIGNGPGDADLVVSTDGGGASDPSVEVWTNDGMGGFTNTFIYTDVRVDPADPLDVDDDKDLDLILVLETEIQILENQAIGEGFTPVPMATIAIADAAELLITDSTDGNAGYDLDEQAGPEIVTVNTDGTVSIAVNTGGFSFAQPVTLDVGSNGVDLTAADYDLDGDIDLAVLADGGDTLYHLRNDTSSDQLAFTRVSTPLGSTSNAKSVRSGDMDEDGADDLVGIGANSSPIAFAGVDPMSETLVRMSNAVPVTPCPGDTNGDDTVNVNDLNNVILDWGTDGSANGGDITGALPGSDPDGAVDVNDLNAVIVGWGACS